MRDGGAKGGVGGAPGDYTHLLQDSPALNASKIRTPLLMQLSEAEYVTTMQLCGVMLGGGKAFEMFVFAGAYYCKNRSRQRLAVYDRNVAWIGFWLRGVVDDNRNRAQLARWMELPARQCAPFWKGHGWRRPAMVLHALNH